MGMGSRVMDESVMMGSMMDISSSSSPSSSDEDELELPVDVEVVMSLSARKIVVLGVVDDVVASLFLSLSLLFLFLVFLLVLLLLLFLEELLLLPLLLAVVVVVELFDFVISICCYCCQFVFLCCDNHCVIDESRMGEVGEFTMLVMDVCGSLGSLWWWKFFFD